MKHMKLEIKFLQYDIPLHAMIQMYLKMLYAEVVWGM